MNTPLCDPYVVRFHPKMTQAHNEGRKCCTTRRHKIGEVGQVFVDENLPGQQFRIISCVAMTMTDVRDKLYQQEGFDSPDDFVVFCLMVYGKFRYKEIVYTHFYAPVLNRELVLNRGGLDE